MRRLALGLAVALALVPVVAVTATGQTGGAGGPIVLMGIDAEDGGPGGHGPTDVYANVLKNGLVAKASKGAGMLVIGGNKSATDDVTEFWNEVATKAGIAVTYANGAAVGTVDFTPFKIIAIASDENQTSGGGLTQAENDALAARRNAIAAHVNANGGLFGMASTFTAGAGAYGYLASVGSFTVSNTSFDEITSTADGQAVGINDTDPDLDVCCWHNTFTRFPNFLRVLATNSASGTTGFGEPAALGGAAVTLGECPGYEGQAGNHIVGTDQSETLKGTVGADIICGLGGNDKLFGLPGDDIVDGGKGNDTLRGGHGNDRLIALDGNDKLFGQPGNDKLNGGSGNDDLFGGRGNDDNNGGSGSDGCKGGQGQDTQKACEH
jgi:Ca2+-binding RTX toxin-like protein